MSATSLRTKMLEAFRKRMFVFMIGVSCVFVIIFLQLINLQIVHGSDYTMRATINMENNIPIPAPRGEMYDRNFKRGYSGTVIVSNRPTFNLTAIPENFSSNDQLRETLSRLSAIIDINPADLFNEIKKSSPWERFIIKDDVSFDIIVKIASHSNLFPHIYWEDAPVRVYNYGELFTHVVGYTGSLSKEEFNNLRSQGYKYYQNIGKSGIERQYDKQLRGEDGFIRRIVNVKNKTEFEEIGHEPFSGNNIVVTLDYEIQKTAYDALGNNHGTVIVLKPSTGEVIALLSKPGYDPNLIISKGNVKFVNELNADPKKPFLNRAIQSRYAPASTFKLITAIAALETERTYSEKSYHCSGKYTLKGYIDHDFYCFRTHGTLNLYWAIGRSCSTYFYNLGMSVGPTAIMRYAGYLGLNEMTGIDIPGEISGFVPSQRWKLRTYGQPWFDGDTINMSIGQGFLAVTPLEVANMLCGIVNNGIVYKPYVVKQVLSPDNRTVISETKKEKLREIPLSPATLETIKLGMRYSVQDGTSGMLNHLKVPAAGKTGTAQTRSNRKENVSQHAWFVGFAPYGGYTEDAIVVAVFVEFGQWGAYAAVPVAERIFAKLIQQGYFNPQEKL